MTSQRAQAYATALKSLRDLKPSKFTDAQMDLFQQTADALFFTDAVDAATADLIACSHAELDVIADNERLLPGDRRAAEGRARRDRPHAASPRSGILAGRAATMRAWQPPRASRRPWP